MKPNHGQNPAPQTHTFLSGLTVRPRWSFPKMSRRILNLSLVLISQAIVHLPGNPALAAECTLMSRELASEGDKVRALQQTLSGNVPGVVVIDGAFGSDTEAAVKSFQRSRNLDPDGVVGPATCRALVAVNNSQLVLPPDGVFDVGRSPSPLGTLETPTPPPTSSSTALTFPPPDNSFQSGPISSGNFQAKGYYVVVPYRQGDNSILEKVRSFIPSAQPQSNRLGSFVNAGSYTHRYNAEALSYFFREKNLDARVIHHR